MNNTFKGIMGVALLSASSFALAVPVTGGIAFSGQSTNFSFDTEANTFDFHDEFPNAAVDSMTGDFVNYFAPDDQVSFFDFTYDPFVGPELIWSGDASVSGTTLSFYLDNAYTVLETNRTVVIDGRGTITEGDNSIEGNWNITANDSSGAFSWSSSTAVPEPGTLALLGLGILGLGAARRRAA